MDKPSVAACGRLVPTTDDLRRLLQELREADGATGLLNSPSTYTGEPLLSSLEKKVEEGTIGYAEVASDVRGICKRAIWANFCGNRCLANHADQLLDRINDAVRYMEARDAPGSTCGHQPKHQTPVASPPPPQSPPPLLPPLPQPQPPPQSQSQSQSQQQPPPQSPTLPLGPVNELLQPTFNPALLKLKSSGGDTRTLLLNANKEKREDGKNGHKELPPGGLEYISPKEGKKGSGVRSGGGKKRRRAQSESCELHFDDVFQRLLAGALGSVLGDDTLSEITTQALANMPPELVKMSEDCGKEIARKQVTEVVRENGIQISGVCDALYHGSFDSLEAAIVHCSSDVMTQWETFKKAQSSKRQKSSPTQGVRLSKIKSACENFLEAIHSCAEELLEAYRVFNEKNGSIGTWNAQPVDDANNPPLPPSIEKNMEAYFQGQWQQAPFEHRAYERLTSFEVCEDRDTMFRRLVTASPDGCSQEFRANHEKHLQGNLPMIEKFLIQAVSERKTLHIGKDIVETDVWGIDCYTRKNVHDAILEADGCEGITDLPSGEIEKKVAKWVEMVLMPAINKQGGNGWDMHCALDSIISAQSSPFDVKAASLIEERMKLVGYNYFRIHPKGQGVLCVHPEGIPSFTFVEEYLGVLHSPWRWFEIQDALKRYNGEDLPDFYNIVLERPRQDPAGYDVLFVDAASKGSVASRMSHSCNPNCQAVVVSCNGRLTIAVYTTRKIEAGEELTFDYSSVTESEKEYRAAVCLCGTTSCRGSFLFFTGSNAFMEVMNTQHTFLHRNMMLLRACAEALNSSDMERLEANGLKDAALGTINVDRVPRWLEKWVGLCLEFVEEERKLLSKQLVKLPQNVAQCTPEQAEAQAKGVSENRIQNIVITLDKIRLALRQPSQPEAPPLMLLPEKDVVDYLWRGDKSVAKRAVRAILGYELPLNHTHPVASLRKPDVEDFASKHGQDHPFAVEICTLILAEADTLGSSQQKLLELERILRDEDVRAGFSSQPLQVSLQSLSGVNLKAGTPSSTTNQAGEREPSLEASTKAATPDSCPLKRGQKGSGKDQIPLFKKYSSHFIWGQLIVWFKQTVNDPAASLSADRRGTLSLPDIESCYGPRVKYPNKDRVALLDHIEKRPDSMWKLGTFFSFKNEAKVYGSPMFDSVWFGESGNGADMLKRVVQELRESPLPAPPSSKKQSANRGKRTS